MIAEAWLVTVLMRMWCNGSTSDFQSDGLGPTPSIRTYKKTEMKETEMAICFTLPVWLLWTFGIACGIVILILILAVLGASFIFLWKKFHIPFR